MDETLRELERAFSAAPGDETARQRLLAAYERAGHDAAELRLLELAVASDPRDAASRAELRAAYAAAGRHQEGWALASWHREATGLAPREGLEGQQELLNALSEGLGDAARASASVDVHGRWQFVPAIAIAGDVQSTVRLELTNPGDEHLELASRLPALTALRLAGARQVTGAGLRHLARTRTLRRLDMQGCSLPQDEDLVALAELPWLCELKLTGGNLTPRGVGHLTGLELLEMGAEFLHALKCAGGLHALTRLRRLALQFTDMTDDELAALLPNLSRLRSLSLWRAKAVTNRAIDHLIAYAPQLEELDLGGSYYGITAAGVARLPDLKRLVRLGLEGIALDGAAVEALRPMSVLRHLTVSADREQVQALREALPECEIVDATQRSLGSRGRR